MSTRISFIILSLFLSSLCMFPGCASMLEMAENIAKGIEDYEAEQAAAQDEGDDEDDSKDGEEETESQTPEWDSFIGALQSASDEHLEKQREAIARQQGGSGQNDPGASTQSTPQNQPQSQPANASQQSAALNPDILVGNWVAISGSGQIVTDARRATLRVWGGNGQYQGVLDGTRRSDEKRATMQIRNLRMTHSGIWITYEGEINCREFNDMDGDDWDYITITYYQSSGKITLVWGCTIGDPPDMVKY